MNRYALLGLILLTCFLILLNALKPMTIDDPVYFHYAAHIAEHPTDPYGFVLFGFLKAQHTLAPPVLLYYWAAVIRLIGGDPFVWKIALLPFGLLFVFSLYLLCRRFAAGLELPLTAMIALSPAFLPSWNLMLDLPALALALTALVLFFHALDRSSLSQAALAGLLAGLAMQTKYTGFVAPAVMLLYALLLRRFRYGLFAASLALLVFVSWEGFTAARYGEAHFLVHVGQRRGGILLKYRLILPLLATLGGVAPWAGLLSLVGLGSSWRRLLLAVAVLLLGFGIVVVVPESMQILVRAADGSPRMTVSGVVFGLFGAGIALATLSVGWRLQRTGNSSVLRIEWFLLLWLVLEVAGYFALTPYPAARRVLGVVVVGTLLAGRLAAKTCVAAERRRLIYVPLVASALLGFGFYAVDVRESRAQAKAAHQAAQWIHRRDPQATIWYMGTQGFPYYAERDGMKRLIPKVTVLEPGSWYVTDGTFVRDEHQLFPSSSPLHILEIGDALPLRTQLCYYASGTPLEHLSGPRAVIRIYRWETK
jgi:Dolichyl-phosphate-mannose-protein mannosyltransferase